MGKNNQQRRAAKAKTRVQAARRRAAGDRVHAGDGFAGSGFDGAGFDGAGFDGARDFGPFGSAFAPGPTPDELARERIAVAIGDCLDAAQRNDQRRHDQAVTALMLEAADEPGRRRVAGTLVESLTSATSAAWRRGWQPADLHRLAGRRLGQGGQPLLADVMVHELSRYASATVDPRWAGQLAECEAQVWWPRTTSYLRARMDRAGLRAVSVVESAMQVLYLLVTLAKLEPIGPRPGEWSAPTSGHGRAEPVDERILARVRALLAKAESTTFEAEAETFTAGAQAMMARHSIDAALLAATAPDRTEAPQARRIGVDNPYEGPKAMLLDSVADTNRCRAVWSKHFGFVTIVGHECDLDATETLFTSLLVQATAALNREGSRVDRYGRSRTRSFRSTFLASYAGRIRERLGEVARSETAAATDEAAATGRDLVPVLAARDQAVDDAFQVMFPEVTTRQVSSLHDAEGYYAGRSAADRAALDVGAALNG